MVEPIGAGQVHFKAGDTVIKQDAVGDTMYMVLSGCCEVSVESRSQGDITGGQMILSLHTHTSACITSITICDYALMCTCL